MAKRCKHELFNVALPSGGAHDRQVRETARWFIRKGLALTVTCSDCGASLPLGKAKGRRLVAFALAEPTADMHEEWLDAQAEAEEARAAKNTAALVAALDARGEAYHALNDAMDADDDDDLITTQTRHDVAAAAARHAELAEFERQRAEEPDLRDEDEEPAVAVIEQNSERESDEDPPDRLAACGDCDVPFGCRDGRCLKGQEETRETIDGSELMPDSEVAAPVDETSGAS